jgi:hypothetical protein
MVDLVWQSNRVFASLGRQCHVVIFTFTVGSIKMWLAVTTEEQKLIIRSQLAKIRPYIAVPHESASKNHRHGLSRMKHLRTGKNMKMVCHIKACRASFRVLSFAAMDAVNALAAVGSTTGHNQIYVLKIITSLGTELLS